ncbi:MAG: lysylphosphatidylglycerol synthase transmembrane domain-containing protein [Promethearchaeota archaeon]
MTEVKKEKNLMLWLKKRKRLLISIGTVILIITMLFLVDIINLVYKIITIGIIGLLFFIILISLSFNLRAYKLKRIFKGIDQNLSYSTAFFSLGVCYFINDLSPGKLGDLTKIVLIKDQDNIQLSRSLCGISIERILDVLFLFVFSCFALIYLYYSFFGETNTKVFLGQNIQFYLLLGVLFLVSFSIILFVLLYKTDFILNIFDKISKKLTNYLRMFLKNYKEGMIIFKNHKRDFVYINFLNFPIYLFDAFITVMFFYLLGYQLNIMILLLAIILTYFSRISPLTPGGWGISENIGALFIFIFYPQIPYTEILSVFIIDHLIRSTFIFFYGGYSIIHYNIRLKEIKRLKV